MKTVFIAHPIAGDIKENIRRVFDICKKVHTKDIVPVAPYVVSLHYLDDDTPEDRQLGIDANLEAFHRKYIDELWLFGDRISNGMRKEIELARELNIPIVPQTKGTKRDFATL